MSRRVLSLAALLTAVLVVALLAPWPEAAAQAPLPEGDDDAPEGIFVEALDVDVVDVDVVVTDADGEFVGGLGAEDFEVLEDGRPVTVTNFYAVDGPPRGPRRPVVGAPPIPAPGAGAGGEAAAPPPAVAEPPPGQEVWVVVYVDNLFLRPFDRNKVLREVRNFLRREVQAGDRVMVASFERSLHVRQPFTIDLQAVQDALLELEEVSAFAVEASSDRRDVIRYMHTSQYASEALNHADFYARQVENDLDNSLDGLRQMLTSLGGLPGRKILVHVSNGLPMIPGEDLFHFYDLRFPNSGFSGRTVASRFDARRHFREIVNLANTNRVAFYTIEGAGLRNRGTLSAEWGSLSNEGVAEGSMIDVDVMRVANEQEPLQLLAVETGGLATVGTNNIDGGLARLGRDLRSYYSLGYVSGHGGDGRYREIEVRVKDPRAKTVRHRSGYRAKGASTRAVEGTLAALLHGVQSNALGVTLALGAPQPSGERGQWLVPVEVRVPLGAVTLLPQSGSHQGRLRLSLAALDADGATSGVQQSEIPLVIPDAEVATAREQDWIYEAQLLMRRGEQRVAVGVRDELAGESSFLERSIVVGQ